MRIKRLKIDNYGPLRDIDFDIDSNAQICFGKNESGKTLIVESIIKKLLGSDSGAFDNLGRVDQSPAGFLLVEKGDKEFRVSDKELDDILPGATAKDIRNIFIIRDFDLRKPREDDFGNSEYFQKVTDRIAGTDNEKIEKVRDRIKEGLLTNNTSEAILTDREKNNKLRSNRDDAKDLIEEIEEYIEKCESEGTLEAVSKLRKKEEKLEALKEEEKEKSERREEIIERIKEVEENLEKIEEKEKLGNGRDLLEDLKEAKSELEKHKERDVSKYKTLINDIDSYTKRDKRELSTSTYSKVGLVSVVVFAILVLGAPVTSSAPLMVVTLIVFGVASVSGYKYWNLKRSRSKEEILVDRANVNGIEGNSLSEVYQNTEELVEDYEKQQKQLEKEPDKIKSELKGKFDAEKDSLDSWKEFLDDFSEELGNIDEEDDEDQLESLEEQKSELKKEKESIEEQKEELEGEIEELEKQLKTHRKKLSEFSTKIASISGGRFLDTGDLTVNGLDSLREAKEVLEQFVQNLNSRVKNAKDTISIFEELQDEEVAEINRIFDTDSYAVETFKKITDGNYVDVMYDEKDESIKVERADGRLLPLSKLSQGTYDLLYMAIRLKLAKDILGDEPGFFILDDAFIHSDSDRLKKEFDILKDLTEDGWQILYFTFRNPVKDIGKNEKWSIHTLPQLDFEELPSVTPSESKKESGGSEEDSKVTPVEKLKEVDGVGRKTAEKILDNFESFEELREASVSRLSQVPSIGKKKAEKIKSKV